MKQKTLHLLPVAQRRVVAPGTRQLMPRNGLVVNSADPQATFWLRRLAEGDVTLLGGGLAAASSTPIQPAAEGGSQEHAE
jgi:hypothetical protein